MGNEVYNFRVLPELLRTGHTDDKRYRRINPDYSQVKRRGSSLNLWWMNALCWLLDDWSYGINVNTIRGKRPIHARQAIAAALRDDLEGHFGGAELLSRTKWGWIVHCVTKVLDVAIKHNMQVIEPLARQWLTTAHALHALCALPESYEPWRTGPSIHNCGPRSPASHWGSQPLDDLFAAHIGAEHSIKPNFAAESPNAERAWQYVLVESCEHLRRHLLLDDQIIDQNLIHTWHRMGDDDWTAEAIRDCHPTLKAAAEYHWLRWPDRVLTLYGNGRNPHSAPLLARDGEIGKAPFNWPPGRNHGRHYPYVKLETQDNWAEWFLDDNDHPGFYWTTDPPLYHVILDGQGIRRIA